MGNWTERDRLIDKYSDAFAKDFDNPDADVCFYDILSEFADEFEELIIEDIKERINNIL